MKKIKLALCFFAAALMAAQGVVLAENSEELTEGRQQRVSYAIGMQIAESLRANRMDLDIETVIRGIKDGYTDREPLMSEAELMETFREMIEEQETEHEAEGELNLERSNRFLEENSQREGVEVTESGLQYEVLERGDGARPEAQDVVEVHYEGTTIDDEVFDSSRQRGESVPFPLEGIVPGLTEGIQLMREGASYRFFLPPELGYGERGVGEIIGPNEALIFEIELIEIIRDD